MVLLDIQLAYSTWNLEQRLFLLFSELCEVVGAIEFCSNLIEIICNPRLKVRISRELYEATARRLQ